MISERAEVPPRQLGSRFIAPLIIAREIIAVSFRINFLD